MIFIGNKATGIASNRWFIAFIHNWSDSNFQIEDSKNTDFPYSSNFPLFESVSCLNSTHGIPQVNTPCLDCKYGH